MLELKSINLQQCEAEALIVPVCEDADWFTDNPPAQIVGKAKEFKEFTGKKDQELILYDLPGFSIKRFFFVGTGKTEQITPETFRALAGNCIKKCIQKELTDVVFAVPPVKTPVDVEATLEAILSGAYLGNHFFDKYKKEQKRKPVEKIVLSVSENVAATYGDIVRRVETICEATVLARNWVTTPSNDKKPEQFLREIIETASRENLTVRVLDEKELTEKKFGAILAVSAGSDTHPGLALLEYRSDNAEKTVVFVGKGVTFDAGGINLKPTDGLKDMKTDMAGAAAVAATMTAVARLKPAVNVIGVIPVVENMPSGKASRPGDVIRTYSGKTVEIGNTDAEGRLILIDAIAYAVEQYKPDILIDLATLTGACLVALGEKIAGVLSYDDELAEALIASGNRTHERCWRLPLPEDYKEIMKSDIADINNSGNTRFGGTITAALFIAEFVENTRWAHIDIAGPASLKKAEAYCDAGGTGFGVRLLMEWLSRFE